MLQQASDHLKEGRFEDAVNTFTACLALDPHHDGALQGRGFARLQLKEWSSAQADFKAAKDLNPDDAEHWIGWGMSLALSNQIYPAIDAFEALLARQPRYVRGHVQLGLLYFKIGVIAKGREQLQKALTLRPTLDERRVIESTLSEQDKLDRRRYYRPDFEALRKKKRV